MEKQIKLWIARDQGYMVYDSQHECSDNINGEYHRGDLHIFYDTPELTGYWKGGSFYDGEDDLIRWKHPHRLFQSARECCKIPSYMFPEVEEGKCYMLRSDALEVDEVIERIDKKWKEEK